MIKHSDEFQIICSTCGKPGILREVVIVESGKSSKISYETHCESVVDPEHIAAQLRIETFYKKVFALMSEFSSLPEETKIVRIENPAAGGILQDLTLGSVRPSACEVRSILIPVFELRTFGKEYEIKLEPRQLSGVLLTNLLREVLPRAQQIIETARDRNVMGLD
jgi:hypothetical protein